MSNGERLISDRLCEASCREAYRDETQIGLVVPARIRFMFRPQPQRACQQ